jgi:hypothetical protein
MTSPLVQRAIDRAGLHDVVAARDRGLVSDDPELRRQIEQTEILALGAAADLCRRRECGDEARIYVPVPPAPSENLVVVGPGDRARGTALLHAIATMRLLGPLGRRIVVDWASVGLEIAQVALSFGATDIAGPIASRRGLPMVATSDNQKLVKRREIAGFVERAGFKPVFVEIGAAPPPVKAIREPSVAEERS